MNKRILHIGPSRHSRGGISSVIKSYFKIFGNKNYQLTWLETQADKNYASKLFSFLKAMILSPWLIYKNEIIHIHTASNFSFYRKAFFILVTKLFRRPLILHIHGGGFSHFLKKVFNRKIRKKVFIELLYLPDIIICLSEAKATELKSVINFPNIRIIPNPAPDIQYLTRKSNYDSLDYVLFTGWIEKEKGVFDLISVFSEIIKDNKKCRLILAGKGQITQSNDLAEKLGINNHVTLTGWLEKEDIYELLTNASAFCLPSYCEGVPMSILEAMAFGLPVVASKVGGVPDIIKNGENGLLFEPGNTKELKEKLFMLLDDDELRKKLGENAKAYVQEKHSLIHVYNKLNLIYKNSLNN